MIPLPSPTPALPRTLLGWLPYLFGSVLFTGSPDPDRRVRWLSLAVVLLLPSALLYPSRGFHLLEPDEGRYAQIPREMLQNGEWVVPTLQGEPYLDKPPLMYWLVALSYRVLGVSPESARLVPALCVHLTILAVYLLGRRSIGERASFWAAVLLAVAPGYVSIARLLLLDGLLVLFVTLSVLCGFEAVRTGRLKLGWWVAAAIASGLGFLTKGPISEVLLFVPLWAFGWLCGTRSDSGTNSSCVSHQCNDGREHTWEGEAPAEPRHLHARQEPRPPVKPVWEGEAPAEPHYLHARQEPRPPVKPVWEGEAPAELHLLHARQEPRPPVTPMIPPGKVRWFHYALFFAVVVAVNMPWYVAIYLREPAFLKHFFWEHNVLRFVRPFDHLQPVWYYAPILLGGLLPGTILLAAYAWKLATGGPDAAATRSPAGGFWLLAGGWCVFFFSCSGSKLPTYVLPAYPFLCLAVGEFVARSRWNAAISTRFAVGAMACLVLAVHHLGTPWYARERSPFGRPELVGRFVTDLDTPVVCYPRNCDSLAFYAGRSDFEKVTTRDTNQLMVDCHHRPRTVILFTHRESLAGFRNTLPPSLEIAETANLRRGYGRSLLDLVFGSTPWGLCDVAVVTPKGQAGALGEHPGSARRR